VITTKDLFPIVIKTEDTPDDVNSGNITIRSGKNHDNKRRGLIFLDGQNVSICRESLILNSVSSDPFSVSVEAARVSGKNFLSLTAPSDIVINGDAFQALMDRVNRLESFHSAVRSYLIRSYCSSFSVDDTINGTINQLSFGVRTMYPFLATPVPTYGFYITSKGCIASFTEGYYFIYMSAYLKPGLNEYGLYASYNEMSDGSSDLHNHSFFDSSVLVGETFRANGTTIVKRFFHINSGTYNFALRLSPKNAYDGYHPAELDLKHPYHVGVYCYHEYPPIMTELMTEIHFLDPNLKDDS
jgi:hypothetical protein